MLTATTRRAAAATAADATTSPLLDELDAKLAQAQEEVAAAERLAVEKEARCAELEQRADIEVQRLLSTTQKQQQQQHEETEKDNRVDNEPEAAISVPSSELQRRDVVDDSSTILAITAEQGEEDEGWTSKTSTRRRRNVVDTTPRARAASETPTAAPPSVDRDAEAAVGASNSGGNRKVSKFGIVRGVAFMGAMKKGPASTSSASLSLDGYGKAPPKTPEEKKADEEVEVLKQFRTTCRRYGRSAEVDGLSKKAFATLVKQLCRWTGQKVMPMQLDLDAAFDIADEDNNGNVDQVEFLHIFHMVKSGRIAGLGGSPTKSKIMTDKERRRLEKKRQSFRDDLVASITVNDNEMWDLDQQRSAYESAETNGQREWDGPAGEDGK